MASSTLRLVTEPTGQGDTISIDVPPAGAGTLHVHFHVGASHQEAVFAPPAAVMPTRKPSRGPWRPMLLVAAGCVVAFVAFDLGARSGANQMEALAAPMPSVPSPFLAAAPPPAAAPSSDLPSALRTELAQPPRVTLPSGASEPPANAFGLHP